MSVQIGRREFITLLAVAAVAPWPLATRAQQPGAKIPRIGIIDNGPPWEPFRQGLRELGYIEGRNITLEYRTAEGNPDRLAAAATEFARLPVDLIATYGTPSTQAAMQATKTIPIVMVGIGDPVGAQLVASLGRPGGNVTGNTVLSADIIAKRLQLLRDLIPTVARVALLWNPENASHAAVLAEAEVAAPALRMMLIPVGMRSLAEFDSAFATIMRERPDALIMTNDPFHQLHLGLVIDFLAKNRLPALFQTREHVAAGGLMSYGANLPDLFRRAAGYAHKILQGTRPADLPIEQPAKFELVINLKTAAALGLTVPPNLLALADEVIE
jgi:putative ABC transport system substrate-binding protein